VLKMLVDTGGQMVMDITDYCKINVDQFYGIEIEEFPCQIAVVGMWLIDHQMNTLVSEHFGLYFARLPLVKSATIVQGNALKIDWENVVPKHQLSYILGNPPFSGARLMSKEQKSDMVENLGNIKGIGNLDYVSAWYIKAARYIINTNIFAAFVSTNSITQGEQVPVLWSVLINHYDIEIIFGYRTFRWVNEARGRAAVHCVIIGFINSASDSPISNKFIHSEEGHKIAADNINPYLVNAPNTFIISRTKPICDVPVIGIGNKPIDGGFYLFTEKEKEEFLKREPLAEKLFRPWIGAKEFINNYKRYCLWVGDCSPSELRNLPEVMKRIEAVKKYRLSSSSAQTLKLAETPRKFHVENIPNTYSIIIPRVSSEKRNFIPIGFVSPDVIVSDSALIIPSASIYHFGVLTSRVHMAWARAVCGRLESRYRYSKDIVYNNFPWPEPTEKQKEDIEKTAQRILDVRELYPESSLADLYDPLTMPPELVKAHNNLDRAVVAAYNGPGFKTEAERVADLMKRYQKITS